MSYIFKTTKGYRAKFCFLFLTVIFSTATEALFPHAIGKIVDEIFYKKQIEGFLLYFFMYAGLYFINQCLHGTLNYLWINLEVTYVVNIRKMCFRHLMKLKATFWTRIKSGDVMYIIQEDTEKFLEFIHRSLFYVIANFLQLSIAIIYLFCINNILGIIAIIMTPIMAFVIKTFSEKIKKVQNEIRNKRGDLDSWILDIMKGITQWKLLNANKKIFEKYSYKTKDIIRYEIKAGYLNIKSESVIKMFTLLGQLSIYVIAAFCIKQKTMTVGEFVACASYFSLCIIYYNALGRKLTNINTNIIGIHRVKDFFQWEEEKNILDAKDYIIENGQIVFNNISFKYEKKPILNNINLSINSGEKVAIVGKSGEGKSTLLHLIYRLYTPDKGKIIIDGKNIEKYTIESVRRQIAVVQQENAIFYGSLQRNITLSDDITNNARIWEIIDGLKLNDLVNGLKNGLDTIIGAEGRELSGGQKQRISLARCIFCNPKILLLDEATSALDEVTEKEVNNFVCKELPQTTIISVAHRFSTVLSAEKIIVVNNGCIESIGQHQTLLKESKIYSSLYEEYITSIQQKKREEIYV